MIIITKKHRTVHFSNYRFIAWGKKNKKPKYENIKSLLSQFIVTTIYSRPIGRAFTCLPLEREI